MRSFLALGFVALLLPACLVGSGEITGAGDDGTGDDGTGGGGGGGGGGGDGSGSGSGSSQPTPRVSAMVDKDAVSTELGKTETLTLTIAGYDGFAGAVTITPSMLSGATAATGYVITATPTSVDLTADGSATVQVTVKVPSNPMTLTPELKLDLTSSAAPQSVTSLFTVANQYTVNIATGTGTAAPHSGLPAVNAPIRLRLGAKLIFHNGDTIQHVIHADGGINHENTALGMPGTDYVTTPTGDATWYCHDHEGSGTARPVLVQ